MKAISLRLGRPDQGAERLRSHHGAGRIVRACHQHAAQRLRAVRRDERFGRQRKPRVAAHRDRHRLAAQRCQHVAIGRIARAREGDAVARLEHGEKRQHEPCRRPGGNNDAFGIDRLPVALAVIARDPPPQRRDAERLRVVDFPRRERCLRRRDGLRGRRRRRLADLHVDDVPAGRPQPRRRRDHVHYHEGRHVAS